MSSFREYYFKLKNHKDYQFSDTIIYALFSDVSSLDKNAIVTHFDDEVPQLEKLDKYVERIINGEPYQYVLGYTYFLGNKFYVSRDVLIPRQETEQLVVDTIKLIREKFTGRINVLDMCSGSGCIGISIAKEITADIDMVDISPKANEVANKNNNLNKTNCHLFLSDMFSDLPTKKYDVIISNPPYIKDVATVEKSTLLNEPHLALFASPQTKYYEEIMKNCSEYLKNNGVLAFEIDEDMEEELTKLVKGYFPSDEFYFKKDIYNKLRFLYIIRK